MILLETNPFLRKLPKLEHSITRRYVNQKNKKNQNSKEIAKANLFFSARREETWPKLSTLSNERTTWQGRSCGKARVLNARYFPQFAGGAGGGDGKKGVRLSIRSRSFDRKDWRRTISALPATEEHGRVYKRALNPGTHGSTIIAHDAKPTHQRPPPETSWKSVRRTWRKEKGRRQKPGCERPGSPLGNQRPHWTVGGIAH